MRGEVLAIREEPFIAAVRAIGSSDRRVLFRHVLPNVFPSIIVVVTLFVPRMIMFTAALTFLAWESSRPTRTGSDDLGGP